MPDEPLYDPDRMVFEDLDFSNLDVAAAYLSHPTTDALVDDLGRSFRQLPASEQPREITEYIGQLEADRNKLSNMLQDPVEEGQIRDTLQTLRDTINNHIESAKLRLSELDDDV